MSPFENDLKDALRREEAPEGFADRVLARAAREKQQAHSDPRESLLTFFTRPLVRWAAAGALAAALIAGGVQYRNVQRERAEGEAAKERLMLAVRIAGAKLYHAKSKVNHPESHEEHEEKE